MDDALEVDFPPVRNGMDFLSAAVDELTGSSFTGRNMKYSVLHLQAATEVLLKACLVKHGWFLVLDNLDKADQSKFKQGDFFSCRVDQAVERLVKIVGINIPKPANDAIQGLAKKRNALLHFGLKTTVMELRLQAVPVLSFLINFIDLHLRPAAEAEDAAHIDEQMAGLRDGLMHIEALIEQRWQEIQPDLEAGGDRLLECPGCRSSRELKARRWVTLLASGDATVRCLMCGRSWMPEHAAQEYATVVQGRSWHDVAQGGEPAIYECPTCDLPTVARGVDGTADPNAPADFCFNCAERFTTLVQCENMCGALVDSAEEIRLCDDCSANAFERL